MLKTCKRCMLALSLEMFPKNSRNKDGLDAHCKTCCAEKTRKWREKNPEAARASEKRWREANPDAYAALVQASRQRNPEKRAAIVRAAAKRYREANEDAVREAAKRWAKANSEKCAARSASRRALQCQAMPEWLSKDQRSEIRAIYQQAGTMTQMTGVAHHVDHIIPLKGETVCGLHVPWNLRVITARENQSKWNRLPEDVMQPSTAKE